MTEKQERPKRGQYKKKECPFCHKMVGNLGNHVAAAHPTEAPAPQPQELTKEELTKPWRTPKPPATNQTKLYACQDCKAEVRKGEQSCWNCGEILIWEGIE